MNELFFMSVYGVLALSGAFFSIFWLRLAYRRIKDLGDNSIVQDKYFFIALILSFYSMGCGFVFGTRTWATFYHGLSSWIYHWEGVFLGIGLSILLAAKFILAWIADSDGHKQRLLVGLAGLTVVWSLVVTWHIGVTA